MSNEPGAFFDESNIKKAVQTFYSHILHDVKNRLNAEQEINRKTGHLFNCLDFTTPNENTMSRIIAYLLDPRGNHGQGETFLRLFAQQVLGRNDLELSGATVRCEAPTVNLAGNEQRRIDILIEGKRFVCGIENKPNAVHQPKQCQDYLLDIERRCACADKAPFLVLLAPLWKIQAEHTALDKEKFCIWYFNDTDEPEKAPDHARSSFFSWLQECQKNCQADKVRHFIGDFENWVFYNVLQY